MTDFVERELLTDHWMRAQSLSDIAAVTPIVPITAPWARFARGRQKRPLLLRIRRIR